MRDFTLFLALMVAVLLACQAKPGARLSASRAAKFKLSDTGLAVGVFAITLALLLTGMALSL